MLDALAPQCLHSYLAFSAPSYKTCLPLCAPLGKLRGRRVITPENLLRPVGPVESAGLEYFQVQIESFGHGSSVEPSLPRHLSNSKFREGALRYKPASIRIGGSAKDSRKPG